MAPKIGVFLLGSAWLFLLGKSKVPITYSLRWLIRKIENCSVVLFGLYFKLLGFNPSQPLFVLNRQQLLVIGSLAAKHLSPSQSQSQRKRAAERHGSRIEKIKKKHKGRYLKSYSAEFTRRSRIVFLAELIQSRSYKEIISKNLRQTRFLAS